MSRQHAISILFPQAIPLDDYYFVDNLDGQGPLLQFWNEAKLGPKPTLEQLDALQEQTDGVEALAVVRNNRAAEYPAIGDQLDAIWKTLLYIKEANGALGPDGDAMLGKIQDVKTAFPKPTPK